MVRVLYVEDHRNVIRYVHACCRRDVVNHLLISAKDGIIFAYGCLCFQVNKLLPTKSLSTFSDQAPCFSC